MDRSPVERILADWDDVASRSQQPAVAPHRRAGRSARGGVSLLPLLAAALAIAVGVTWLGGKLGGVGGPGTSAPPSSVTASPDTATPTPSAVAVTPSAATGAPCDPDRLAVAITGWDGAAGSRTATLTLRLDGTDECTIESLWRPELVDGSGRIRIEGAPVSEARTIELRSGETLTTLAQASNDCGPTPAPPVTIAFILGDGSRIVAAPPSPTDVTTAPCNGPGQPGAISMQAWTR